MMSLFSSRGIEAYGVQHFTVDEESEIESLPTDRKAGSTIFCIETSETYMLNSQKEWIKVTFCSGGSSSDSGSDTPLPDDVDEIIYDGGLEE